MEIYRTSLVFLIWASLIVTATLGHSVEKRAGEQTKAGFDDSGEYKEADVDCATTLTKPTSPLFYRTNCATGVCMNTQVAAELASRFPDLALVFANFLTKITLSSIPINQLDFTKINHCRLPRFLSGVSELLKDQKAWDTLAALIDGSSTSQTIGSISLQDLRSVKLWTFAFLKPMLRRTLCSSKFSDDQKTDLCTRTANGELAEVLGVMCPCGCVDLLINTTNLDRIQRQAGFKCEYQKLKTLAGGGDVIMTYTNCRKLLRIQGASKEMDNLQSCPTAAIKESVSPGECKDMSKDKREIIRSKLNALAEADRDSTSNRLRIACGEPADIEGLTAEELTELPDFEETLKDSSKTQKRKIKEKFDNKNLNTTEMRDVLELFKKEPKKFDSYTDQEFQDIASAAGDKVSIEGPRDCAGLARRLRDAADFNQGSKWDGTKLRNFAYLLSGMQASFLDAIDNTAWGDCLDNDCLDNVKGIPTAVCKIIKKKAKAHFNIVNTWTEAQITKLRLCAGCLDFADIDTTGEAEFTDAVMRQMNEAWEKKTCKNRAAAAKLATKAGVDRTAESGGLKEVSARKVKDKSLQQLGIDPSDTSNCSAAHSDTTRAQDPIIMDKIKAEFGQIDAANTKYSTEVFECIGKPCCGLKSTDIDGLPDVDDTLGICAVVGEQGCESRALKKKVAQKAMDLIPYKSADIDSRIVRHLPYVTEAVLREFDCTKISGELAEADVNDQTTSKQETITTICLECKNKDTAGQSLTSSDIDGSNLCGIPKDRITDIDAEEVENLAEDAEKCMCSWKPDKRQEFYDKIKRGIDFTRDTGDQVSLLGAFAPKATQEQINQLSDDTLRKACPAFAEAVEEMEKKSEERKHHGFHDLTTDEESQEEEGKKRLFRKCGEAHLNTATAAGRKKRTTTTWTCADMTEYESIIGYLMTAADMTALSNNDFTDCIDILNSALNLDTDQKTALATKAKQAWGNVNTWAVDEITSCGQICHGLDHSELSQLVLDANREAISALGDTSGWTDTQLSALFNNHLDTHKGSDASTLSADDLMSLGEFVCGATPTLIAQIPAAQYSYAAEYVGAVDSCTETQQVAWADKAKAAFGSDVSTWAQSEVTMVNIMLGGLTGAELSSLSTVQIQSIPTEAIREIPPSKFRSFTTTQMGAMTVNQLSASTTEQYAQLSTEQKAFYTNNGVTIPTTVQSDGAATKMSVVSIVTMCLLAFLFAY